jgi:hypothetical protein
MYDWLVRFLPPRLAGGALAFWYAFLILLVLYCAQAPELPFRYGEI